MSQHRKIDKLSHAVDFSKAERDRALREEHNHQQGLLRLPTELRIQIYEYLTFTLARRHFRMKKDEPLPVFDDEKSHPLHPFRFPALLSVCRGLRAEFLPVYFSKATMSLELRELLKPSMRRRSERHRRWIFLNAVSQGTITCPGHVEIRCQWRCMDSHAAQYQRKEYLGFGPYSSGPQGRYYCRSRSQWVSWGMCDLKFVKRHNIDAVVVEVVRDGGREAVNVKCLAEIRGEHLQACCQETAREVADKLVLEVARMGLHDRNHKLRRDDFEMLARRMRWSAWRKRWYYRLSKHSFVLAWHDLIQTW